MQWTSYKFNPSVIYTSVDDDMLVHVPNLINHIRSTYAQPQLTINKAVPCYQDLPIICTYSYQAKDIPDRKPKSKWYMPKKWYPNDTWPCYCRGGMYVAPVKIVRDLFEVSRRTERLYLDDVWITGFMRRKLGRGDLNIAVSVGLQLEVVTLASNVIHGGLENLHIVWKTKYICLLVLTVF